MGSKRRSNTFTRFLEDIVDATKDLGDDLLDRAKDVEENAKDAIKDVTDDDDSADVAALHASLASLQAKVAELTALQSQAAKGTSAAKA